MKEFRIVLADACKIVKESSRKRVISGADEDGRVMVEFSEPVGGRRVKMLTPEEINGMLYKEETSESPVNAEEAMAEETEPPTAGQEESGESALERIPKDAQTGEPQYTQTDADTAWDALVEQCGGDADMAQGVADSMVKDMETALKKAEKSAPAHGVTVAEKIAAAKGHKAAVEKARTELEKWRAIAGETASRARAAEEAERRRKKERLDAAREELRRNGRYAKEDAALGDYTDFADYAMRTIATGKYRFLWGDRESGTQGLGAHLGFTGSRTERNKRIWLLSKDGFTPEEAAERMLADYSAAAGFDSVGDTGVDSMEALDVILDVLRRYTSPRAMMDDAKAAHAENGESAEERRQGEEYERGQFMEAYHMTPEEYYEYENEWLPRYMEEAAQVPQEVIDNINAEYAEKYSENGKDDYNGGKDGRGVPPVQGERLDKPGGDEGGGDTGGAAGAVGEGDAAGGFVPQGASGREVRAGEVPQPVGKGAFGDIYDQFRGDAKAAFDFLTKHRSGDLLGVFHRDDTGDIDLVWGDENSGLSHILTKHVGKGKDFGTEQAAFDKIESILKNGKLIQDGRLRYVVSEDGYRVAIRKDYDGVKKNWIVTAVDYNRSKEEKEITTNPTSASHGANGPELAAPNNSKGKVTEESADLQENGGKDAGGKAEMPLSEQIDAASAEVNTEPTEAQKEAGNYKKGHVQVGMFDITIEQPEGSIRRGTDAAGKQWESKMHNTYGYFRGTEGVDGDHIDVFLSNDIDVWNGRKVYVVDQYNPDGTFDEHKVMLGFNDMDEAKGDYLANYKKGWENGRRIVVSATNLEDFEKWIDSSHRKTKPFAEYAGVKKETVANTPAKEEAAAPTDNANNAAYTITPATYTNKKGKTSDVSLLTFNDKLTADQERAVKEFAKERLGEGRFAPARGWKDRESGGWMFRLLEDDDPKAIELESLPDSELVPVYRNAQAFEDDALGSPMAFTDAETGERRTLQGGKWNYSNPPQIELTPEQQRQLDELNKNGYIVVDDKKTTELQINDGLKFVKPKTKDAQLQYFLKKNPEDKGLWAAYDPYDHAIETPLNTQFAGAYNRPNLVVVRSLIPKSEIDEPFHADYALLPTGAHQWNNGRTLYLSRWSKIDKVLTREEEAKMIDEYWKKHPGKREALKSHRDYNRFVPQVRRELEKMGYRFELDGKELTPEESRALDEQNWESRDVIPGREGHTPFVSNEDIARINAKMSGKWVGEPKEAMENAMTARVNELAERLHTPVRIVRTDEEVAALPSARQRRMKGSFNPMTGEVTIVVPNNANMADVENTFIHEVVGHDGLRVLFPEEEKLNNALDELYRVSKDEIRNSIDRMAQKMYDAEVDRLREKKRKEHEANGEDSNASYYADMAEAHAEASKKREQFKRDATEEYGADLAGRIGEKGFEKMSAEELTFWGKLKSMLQNALRKLAEGLGIPGVRKWGDNEWAFVLHEAYKRKRNGGRPSVADAADTVSARESTGFDGGLYRVGDFVRQREQEGNLEEVNRRFNGRLDELTEENADEVRLELGMPNRILKASGIPGKPMVLYGNKIIKKANKHGFAPTDIKNLPKVLQSPIAVFEGSHKDSFAILTEMSIGGKNVLVSIETNKKGELDFNIISSVFGKNNKGVIDWVNKGKLLYADKEKALRYISASAHIADATYKAELDTAANVVRNFENPKVSGGKVSGEDLMFRDGDAKDYEKAQARETYERRVSTGMFQSREAIQDSMLSLKVAMDAIEEATAGKAKRIEDYDGFENAYLGENRLSSVNQAESAAFAHLLIRPMMEEVNRLAPTAEDRAELIDYMFAKHGLERNAYMRQQAAEKKLAEYKKQNPGTAKTAADFIDAERDYAGLTTLTGEADVSAAEAEAQRMVAEYEKTTHFMELGMRYMYVERRSVR